MNINEEGKYYASMVRKFRTEYKSKNLHGFCKEQKVSYTKMLHCLRNDSYRKPSAIIFILKARFLLKRYSIPTISSSQSSMRKRDAIISHGRALSIWLKELF